MATQVDSHWFGHGIPPGPVPIDFSPDFLEWIFRQGKKLTEENLYDLDREYMRGLKPQNPRPLTGAEIDKLGSNLEKFLNDPECGKFINALLGSLPADTWKTTRYSGSLPGAFNRIKRNGGFWSDDTISRKALAITNPNALKTTFDSQRITPLITGQSWQQFYATVVTIHELTHVFTNAPDYGTYGHLQMAQAASDAASSLGLDAKSGLEIDFPTQKKYGTGLDYEVALSEYYNKTLAYACRKVKL